MEKYYQHHLWGKHKYKKNDKSRKGWELKEKNYIGLNIFVVLASWTGPIAIELFVQTILSGD